MHLPADKPFTPSLLQEGRLFPLSRVLTLTVQALRRTLLMVSFPALLRSRGVTTTVEMGPEEVRHRYVCIEARDVPCWHTQRAPRPTAPTVGHFFFSSWRELKSPSSPTTTAVPLACAARCVPRRDQTPVGAHSLVSLSTSRISIRRSIVMTCS